MPTQYPFKRLTVVGEAVDPLDLEPLVSAGREWKKVHYEITPTTPIGELGRVPFLDWIVYLYADAAEAHQWISMSMLDANGKMCRHLSGFIGFGTGPMMCTDSFAMYPIGTNSFYPAFPLYVAVENAGPAGTPAGTLNIDLYYIEPP
jgi:hypothetical protein